MEMHLIKDTDEVKWKKKKKRAQHLAGFKPMTDFVITRYRELCHCATTATAQSLGWLNALSYQKILQR